MTVEVPRPLFAGFHVAPAFVVRIRPLHVPMKREDPMVLSDITLESVRPLLAEVQVAPLLVERYRP